MKIDKISFEKSNTKDADAITEAENHLFSAAGVSSLLFNKDMSRLGRDHLRVGLLLEQFRERGIRFIAINDGVDTDKGIDDFTPFRNIINEWVARDTSRKIRAINEARTKEGKRVTGAIPYGYLHDPNDRQKWILDEEAAPILKRMFLSIIEGKTVSQIAHELSAEGILSAGMCSDICIHDKNDGNPHAHIMLTMRPFEPTGEWGAKSKKEYLLDENGERLKLKNGNFKTAKINTVDWNEQTKAEEWRSGWSDIVNQFLEKNNVPEKVDHRSYERQGIDQIPTIHMGVSATQMERKGRRTDRGRINRNIEVSNRTIRQAMYYM